MAQLTIRIDNSIKEQAESVFERIGLSTTAAVTLFLRQAILQKGIPFTLNAGEDPLYNPANITRIQESIAQFKEGRFIEKSIEELEIMADE